MTAADVIRMCVEMDQQFISGRPSPMARAAEIVQELCRHAEGSIRDPRLLGDYESIDLAPVRAKRVSGELWQPTMGLVEENRDLEESLKHARTLVGILQVRPRSIARRPGGRWDVFDDPVELRKFEAEAQANGEIVEAWNVSEWNIHSAPDHRETP